MIRLLEGVCPQLKEVVLNDYKEAKGQQQQQRTEKRWGLVSINNDSCVIMLINNQLLKV